MATIRHEESEVMLIPKVLARSDYISPGAKAVYLFAASLRDDEESSTEYISVCLGIRETDLCDYVDELNKAGLMRFRVTADEH